MSFEYFNYISTTLFVLLLLLITTLSTTEAFDCYVCDSKNDIECTENLPADHTLKKDPCANITDAKYCIKTTNMYAGELGTKRFCAANDHGNYCRYVKQATGDREYRSCVLTCATALCNGSKSTFIDGNVFYTVAPLIIYTLFLVTSL